MIGGGKRSTMSDPAVECSVRLGDLDQAVSGRLIIHLRANLNSADKTTTVADRMARAAAWALDLDSQYRDMIGSGASAQVVVHHGQRDAVGRVQFETLSDYRRLRLDVGELVRPLLLDPPELGKLFPFQRNGVEWLIERSGGILADDMGLGKTVQVIAAIRLLFNRAEVRNVLVVCPKGLIAMWKREFSRWAPELGVIVVTPPARIREDAWQIVSGHCHVLLTNYEQLRDLPEILQRTAPDLIVADEAHRLRNRHARITSGGFRLKPKRFWALTGTPIERDLEDLATLLSLVVPNRFAFTDAKLHASSLRSRARAYVLRRRKDEILKELPPVLDTTEALELSEAQARSYKDAIKQYRKRGRRGDELALLTRLQMLCDIDPESGKSSKAERIIHLLGRIRKQKEKAVVFSYRLEPLRTLQRRIVERWGAEAAVLLVGEMDNEDRERSVTYFRDDGRPIALLASSRVGGEGLTLVEASHVFLFNQWWNPSANDQARDRVVRIGQHRSVRVYRFCCRGTIEEALERILRSKREVYSQSVERLAQPNDASWSRLLSDVGIDRLLSNAND